MATSESVIVKNIREALKKEYYPSIFIYKSHGGQFQRVGLPDLIMCIRGRFVGIEVKRPDTMHTVTALQRQCLNEINAAGGLGIVCCDPETALNAVATWLNKRV